MNRATDPDQPGVERVARNPHRRSANNGNSTVWVERRRGGLLIINLAIKLMYGGNEPKKLLVFRRCAAFRNPLGCLQVGAEDPAETKRRCRRSSRRRSLLLKY